MKLDEVSQIASDAHNAGVELERRRLEKILAAKDAEIERLRAALEFFLNSLNTGRRGGLTPAKDFSDWATVEFVACEALNPREKTV